MKKKLFVGAQLSASNSGGLFELLLWNSSALRCRPPTEPALRPSASHAGALPPLPLSLLALLLPFGRSRSRTPLQQHLGDLCFLLDTLRIRSAGSSLSAGATAMLYLLRGTGITVFLACLVRCTAAPPAIRADAPASVHHLVCVLSLARGEVSLSRVGGDR